MIKIKFKKIFSFLIKIKIILYSLILIYMLAILIHDFIDPKTTVRHLFLNKYIVSSGSMQPTIKEGDAVVVFRINKVEELKESINPHIKPNDNTLKTNSKFDKNNDNGDIIVFQNKHNPKEMIIHRVVVNDKKNKKITTLGDNNIGYNHSDKDIDYDQVVGKYIFKFNKIYLFILTFLILFILFFVF
ncbi:S26 family signal peptidase [Candidatus Phytoplasma prunorum]|uniref:S26 family signal peptidase n=1 Tax=Candidatus Phytoplasma prunorum TaxID=47565 RepID=UPI002FF315E3